MFWIELEYLSFLLEFENLPLLLELGLANLRCLP